ncbi:MAG: hypothetical protein ABI243_05835 [Lapillicoccus sp.]
MSDGHPGAGDEPVDIFTGRPIRDRRPRRGPQPPWGPRSVRLRRTLAAVGLVVGTVVAVVGTRHQGTPPVALPPSVTSTEGTTVESSPTAGVAPHDALLSTLPWSTVGPGWTALVWQTAQGIDTAHQRHGLYLVSPSGVRYRVGDVFGGTVVDVSPDGRRILVSTGGQPAASVAEWDVTTGTSRTIPLASGLSAPGAGTSTVRYTRPAADALIAAYTSTGTAGVVLERRGLDGVLQQRFPPVSDAAPTASDTVLPTPDGHDLLVATTTGLALLDTDVGAVVRRYPLPLGRASCSPRGWWADGVALARCDASGTSGLAGSPSVPGPVSDLWTVPVDGSREKRLTTADGSMPVGFVAGWSTAIGTVALEGAPRSESCVAAGLDVVATDGTRTLLGAGVPSRGASDPATTVATAVVLPLAVTDRWAYLLRGACGRPSALVAYDLVGGTAHPLTGAGVDGGTVVSAVTIGRDD